MNSFDAIADLIRGKFAPTLPVPLEKRRSDRKVTLHAAIKTYLGMDPDLSLLAYDNRRGLNAAMDHLWSELDRVLARRDADYPLSSRQWALASHRTEDEVLELLADAEPIDRYAGMAKRRPEPPGLLGKGKYRAAIAAEAARIVGPSGNGYVELFRTAIAETENDEDLLVWLEQRRPWNRLNEPRLDRGPLPVQITRAFGRWFSDDRGISVREFLAHVLSSTELTTDQQFLEALGVVAAGTTD